MIIPSLSKAMMLLGPSWMRNLPWLSPSFISLVLLEDSITLKIRFLIFFVVVGSELVFYGFACDVELEFVSSGFRLFFESFPFPNEIFSFFRDRVFDFGCWAPALFPCLEKDFCRRLQPRGSPLPSSIRRFSSSSFL